MLGRTSRTRHSNIQKIKRIGDCGCSFLAHMPQDVQAAFSVVHKCISGYDPCTGQLTKLYNNILDKCFVLAFHPSSIIGRVFFHVWSLRKTPQSNLQRDTDFALSLQSHHIFRMKLFSIRSKFVDFAAHQHHWYIRTVRTNCTMFCHEFPKASRTPFMMKMYSTVASCASGDLSRVCIRLKIMIPVCQAIPCSALYASGHVYTVQPVNLPKDDRCRPAESVRAFRMYPDDLWTPSPTSLRNYFTCVSAYSRILACNCGSRFPISE